MLSTKKMMANAVGARHVRACDSCIKKRARWYCAADDAFLCQACDSSVHLANPLARRHTRVRLKTASARTRRAVKGSVHTKRKSNPVSIVPEIGIDEVSHEENEEEQLLYRVPIFDPFVDELCTSTTSNEAVATESKALLADGSHGVFPFRDGSCRVCRRCRELARIVKKSKGEVEYEENTTKTKKKKPFLSLDYEASFLPGQPKAPHGLPWPTGFRPRRMDRLHGKEVRHSYGGLILIGMGGQIQAMGDGGREARVSRYREKRRTRLFSKKIRYEVRKLNAEKRPRMKGRFVKRTSFP
ncbi:Zinc finger protein CONSTANS-LIKE 6 [Hibiscus syriacus]|uniref:Zinc finger protein CONSTANS-LIKE 6 n=1 Tax=Hibiscus syriacus TaxID=106335 RepID=A0A6A3CA41_HIBSY|nr:Zinc finger protein CONSTANS-LIKE 6 [Hibiscus syriacus]